MFFEEAVFSRGERVFEKGQQPDYMYLVKRGSVRVVQEIDGREHTLTSVEQGDFFGYEDLFFSPYRSFRAVAQSDGTLLSRIHKHVIEALLEDQTIGINLSKVGRNRLNYFQDRSNSALKTQDPAQKVYLSTFYGLRPTLKSKKVLQNMDPERKNTIFRDIRRRQLRKEMGQEVSEQEFDDHVYSINNNSSLHHNGNGNNPSDVDQIRQLRGLGRDNSD